MNNQNNRDIDPIEFVGGMAVLILLFALAVFA